MGQTSTIITKVSCPTYGKVLIETVQGDLYFSDLSSLSKVYCYPKNKKAWEDVSIDQDGLALVWSCRFEAHVDQIIALSTRVEKAHNHQNNSATA